MKKVYIAPDFFCQKVLEDIMLLSGDTLKSFDTVNDYDGFEEGEEWEDQ